MPCHTVPVPYHTFHGVQIYVTEHIVPHDEARSGISVRDVFEDTAYVSKEHLSLCDSLRLHATLTRLAETNVEHL